jgi:hypothetical protein
MLIAFTMLQKRELQILSCKYGKTTEFRIFIKKFSTKKMFQRVKNEFSLLLSIEQTFSHALRKLALS